MGEKTNIKTSYQTMGEICKRLNCGRKRVLRLIDEGLPASYIAGQYIMSEKRYMEWLENLPIKPKQTEESFPLDT